MRHAGGDDAPYGGLGTLGGLLWALDVPEYRRLWRPGGTYCVTQVTYDRYPWLCTERGRAALRHAVGHVRGRHPFRIEAFVLLPDHFHLLLTLPPGDSDLSLRMRLIKGTVTKYHGEALALPLAVSASRKKRRERNLWQRRFWDRLVRDEREFLNQRRYIHRNPVKHGLCSQPEDWPFSTIHRQSPPPNP